MAYPRVNRLNEEIKKLASNIIRNELRDPRISSMTSIINVDVTRDLRYATIYVSILGNQEEKENTMAGLQKSAGFVRREVGKKIKTRYTPEVIFKLDDSIEKGVYMYHKINEVNENLHQPEDEKDEEDGE